MGETPVDNKGPGLEKAGEPLDLDAGLTPVGGGEERRIG